MKSLVKFIESQGLQYTVIPADEIGKIVLIQGANTAQGSKLLKSRLEMRPSTLGLSLKTWDKSKYFMEEIGSKESVQIVFASDDLLVKYLIDNSIDEDGIMTVSRVGYILFLSQVNGNEKKVAELISIVKDKEFNFAFYLSVQTVANTLYSQDPETYSDLVKNIVNAFLLVK